MSDWEKCFVCPSLVVEAVDRRIKRKQAKSVRQACNQLYKESEGTWPSEAIRGFYNRLKVVHSEPKIKKPNYETCTIQDLYSLIEAGKTFSTIYADPPWEYSNQATRASTSKHYKTMTLKEIAKLPIRKLTTKNAHLHLWTTNAFLFDCPYIMQAWGFEYKSIFVWVKPQMGIGNYWRVSHEFLLLGVRGSLTFQSREQMSWRELRRGRHSQKPEEIADVIEKVSPGPYLELFGRRERKNWTVWGNEIPKQAFLKM